MRGARARHRHAALERFPAKWEPARRRKRVTRKESGAVSDSNESETAVDFARSHLMIRPVRRRRPVEMFFRTRFAAHHRFFFFP
jgi:hypothetical protein